ncbi:Transcription factor SKN7 [Phytophthora citrophthora]|uniref:Transcription factor SKN7 n=1 Tax=Phytophthora citrophthora TaxID=4793 RepID=A0AAD9LC51_9STRA|nr:Transcription factor SKN7 [Phytophthora citrophthora]
MAMQTPALPAIATSFVRKLYRILDQESASVIAWDTEGSSFVMLDNDALETQVLPRYFRGRLNAFRQQLKEHSFVAVSMEDGKEQYSHPFFRRGCPEELNQITHTPLPRKRAPRKKKRKQPESTDASEVKIVKSISKKSHRVPVRSEPEPEFKHAAVDPATLAANPLFAQEDDSLSGFLTASNMPVEPTGPLLDSMMQLKDEQMSADVMEALLALLSTSLSTEGRTEVILTAPTTNANSTSSTGSHNIFAEGRPPVVLPPLPPGIVENGQFSEDTMNNLMHWVSANATSTL